jgi:hypothetical protein
MARTESAREAAFRRAETVLEKGREIGVFAVARLAQICATLEL